MDVADEDAGGGGGGKSGGGHDDNDNDDDNKAGYIGESSDSSCHRAYSFSILPSIAASSSDIAFALAESLRKISPDASASVSSSLRASVVSMFFSIAANSCCSLYERFRFAFGA